MRLRVYLKDGRTCYRVKRRSDLTKLLTAKPDGQHDSVVVEVAYWVKHEAVWEVGKAEPVAFLPVQWVLTRVRFIAPNSVSHVEQDPPLEDWNPDLRLEDPGEDRASSGESGGATP